MIDLTEAYTQKLNVATLKEAAEEWLKELDDGKRQKTTLTLARQSITRFIDYLEAEGIEEVTPKAANAYRHSMEQEIEENHDNPKPGRRYLQKTSTANKWIDNLNRFFKRIRRYELILDRLEDTTDNVNDEVLTEKEYRRILEWADRMGETRIKLIIETLVGTGMRVSELKYITVEAVRPRKRTARVTNKGKTRNVVIPKQLAKKLREYAEAEGIETGIIFHGRDKDKLIDTSVIRKGFKRIAGKARGIKLNRIHPHTLRHLFAIRYEATPGAIPGYLPYLLGHSTKNVTDIYKKPSTDTLKKAVDDMEAYYIRQDREAKKKEARKKGSQKKKEG